MNDKDSKLISERALTVLNEDSESGGGFYISPERWREFQSIVKRYTEEFGEEYDSLTAEELLYDLIDENSVEYIMIHR